ncbi:MAG: hypothetical protein WEC12_02020 [Balneolaceae bacterium]
MNKRTITAGISFLLLMLSGICSVTAQELHTYVDRDSVQVGDIISYILVLEKDREYSSVLFPGEEQFDNDRLLFAGRERHSISSTRDSVVYKLQFFGTGDMHIPAQTVELTDPDGDESTVKSSPVPLFFKTVLEGDDEFRPLKPIFDFTASVWPWLLVFLLLGLILWYLYRLYRKRERKEEPVIPEPPPEPFVNPLDILKNELNALSGPSSPLKKRNFNEFYISLGDAIRAYFERVYKIAALEMTSGEILRSLREYPAEQKIIDSTRNVLNEADMVKFARFEPDVPQAERTLLIAFQFLDVVSKADEKRISKLRELHEQKQTSRNHDSDL